jgi:hypothetical protein
MHDRVYGHVVVLVVDRLPGWGPANTHQFPAAIFATACSTGGGHSLILFIWTAAFQSFSSESHLPLANIPVFRMQYFAIQKI